MRIILKGTNLELNQELRDYVDKKIGGLDKFLENIDGTLEARVELAKTTRHHQHGDIYRAEVNLDFSGKVLRAVEEKEDSFTAIDGIENELKREVIKFKTKRTAETRRGARIIKKFKHLSPLSWAKNEFRKFNKRRYKR